MYLALRDWVVCEAVGTLLAACGFCSTGCVIKNQQEKDGAEVDASCAPRPQPLVSVFNLFSSAQLDCCRGALNFLNLLCVFLEEVFGAKEYLVCKMWPR